MMYWHWRHGREQALGSCQMTVKTKEVCTFRLMIHHGPCASMSARLSSDGKRDQLILFRLFRISQAKANIIVPLAPSKP